MVAKLAIIEVGPIFADLLDSELEFHDGPLSRIPQDRECLNCRSLRDTLLTVLVDHSHILFLDCINNSHEHKLPDHVHVITIKK